MNLNKIPATVVTGFLGSGKTTLLSNILKNANGKRIAVIVNEFGELDIDADLLRSCPLDCEDESTATDNGSAAEQNGVYELANGCICCTVQEEFFPVMKELVARRDQIDHILIETSGLALPKPLVQAFNWPEVKAHCTVDAVITVVDGPAVAERRFANNPEAVEQQRLADAGLDHDPTLEELFEDQLRAADLVILSKRDLMDDSQVANVERVIRDHVPAAVKIVEVSQGQVDTALILGLEAASEERIETVHTHHDHHHAHDAEHHHAHDHFNSVTLTLGDVDGAAVQAAIAALVSTHCIYRVKGFLALPGKPMRQVIQGVGRRMDSYFDRLWQADEVRQSKIVLIGRDLEHAVLAPVLQATQVDAAVPA